MIKGGQKHCLKMHKIQGWHVRPHGGRLLVIPFAHTSLPCFSFTPCSLTTCVHKPIRHVTREMLRVWKRWPATPWMHLVLRPISFTAVPNNVMGYKGLFIVEQEMTIQSGKLVWLIIRYFRKETNCTVSSLQCWKLLQQSSISRLSWSHGTTHTSVHLS